MHKTLNNVSRGGGGESTSLFLPVGAHADFGINQSAYTGIVPIPPIPV